MITLHQVEKFYGKQDVLAGVSLRIGPGERLGLVGPNGAGKSTLLNLILGNIEPDGGSVFRAKRMRLGYLPQDLVRLRGKSVLELAMETGERLGELEEELAELNQAMATEQDPDKLQELIQRHGQVQCIFEGLGGYDLEARAQKVLAGLGFTPHQIERDVGELSGGWLMRAALARILLSGPELILLDEPTNHLDIDSLIWLENHLIQSPASLMLVSHDRRFLDRVVNRIVEIDRGQLFVYTGNYTQYLEQREGRLKAWRAAYENQQSQIAQIERFIEQARSRAATAKLVQSRVSQLEKMEKVPPPPNDQAVLSLALPKPDRSAKVVVELDRVTAGYGGEPIYRDLDLILSRGERLAILGKNGAGKSTLLKLMSGQLEIQAGRRLVGGRVRMGIFSQHSLEDLNPENDVLTEAGLSAGMMPQASLRALLGRFLFTGDDVFKKVKVLSGGERSRLVLCRLLLTAPNLLLLDEPTNHLDIASRRVLEKALAEYDGTIVIISHDRDVINAVANRVAYVEPGGRITVLPGNYNDFERLWKDRLGSMAADPAASAPACQAPGGKGAASAEATAENRASGPKTQAQKRAEAELRQQRKKVLGPLRQKVERLEAEVDQLGARLAELEAELAKREVYEDGARFTQLSKEHGSVRAEMERGTEKWEQAALQLEEAEAQFGD